MTAYEFMPNRTFTWFNQNKLAILMQVNLHKTEAPVTMTCLITQVALTKLHLPIRTM